MDKIEHMTEKKKRSIEARNFFSIIGINLVFKERLLEKQFTLYFQKVT